MPLVGKHPSHAALLAFEPLACFLAIHFLINTKEAAARVMNDEAARRSLARKVSAVRSLIGSGMVDYLWQFQGTGCPQQLSLQRLSILPGGQSNHPLAPSVKDLLQAYSLREGGNTPPFYRPS
jgi:hypothetical protein